MLTTTHSENAKLGSMAATYRGKQSCPVTCGAYKACYAKFGATNYQFARATQQGLKEDANKILQFIINLPLKHKIRHFVSGDLVNTLQKIDWGFVKALISGHSQRPDVTGFGYTHSWKKFRKNPFVNKNLTINASCDKPKEIEQAKKRGFDTVLIVPETVPHGKTVYNGVTGLVCPNQAAKKLIKDGKKAVNITCDNCMLCAKQNRDYTIFFWAHGNGKKHLNHEQN